MLTITVNREAQTQEHTFDPKVLKTWDAVLNVIEYAEKLAEDEGWRKCDGFGDLPEEIERLGVKVIVDGGVSGFRELFGILSTAKRWAEWSLQCTRMQHAQQAMMMQAQQEQAIRALTNGGGRKLHL